jgi:hypothetical protein
VGTLITAVAILGLIGLGVVLIHRLNALHGSRIALFRYSRSRQDAQARPAGSSLAPRQGMPTPVPQGARTVPQRARARANSEGTAEHRIQGREQDGELLVPGGHAGK